ncbi:carbohydrate ABC transporter permease [Cellulomonas denverensis]|uniref:Sugar ABC transporter permease n=1 Tax=Cellulomonas denverensis TaxID=264297 RepID=A0A7X6KT19_9CELL|nr:sugar ABC transporter permease [Cellulomonas denverensis]NKY21478.1 sugar ABC transporter permease [Cellulomonas denverensis]GIG26990.1 sugar ABC transporter permease [Cellulomonas denverensis]
MTTAAPRSPARAVTRRGRGARRRERTAWLFLAPSLLTIAVFMLWPMIQSAYLSFMDYNRIQPARWVGLANYRELLTDPAVHNALGNTLVYAVVVTPLTVGLALALALMLNRAIFARGLIRTAVFLPFIVSLAIVAIAWAFLLDPNIGLISHWLDGIGIVSRQGWLSDPKLAMPAVMIVGIWKTVGFYMVMYLAGLQSIPTELYEAASLDGAGPWTRFRNVTWPLLSNQTMLISIMAAIATLQAFDQIYVMTHGGPYFQTETLVMLVYRVGFEELRLGYGSAISWVLLLGVFVLSMLQFGYFRKRAVTY